MKIEEFTPILPDLARCPGCEIGDSALCSEMTEEEFDQFNLTFEDIQYPAGTFLFRQGGVGGHIFTLRQGMVKLIRLRENGEQRILRILRPGDVAGLEALISKKYAYDVIALEPVLACRIPVEVIKKLDIESPRLHQKLMGKWQQTLHEADEWMAELTAGTARVRLARLLLKTRHPNKPEFSTLFSREDVGSMLCMTMETASRTINAFQREGKITPADANGRSYKINGDALREEILNGD